jgi:hypothetical protein
MLAIWLIVTVEVGNIVVIVSVLMDVVVVWKVWGGRVVVDVLKRV